MTLEYIKDAVLNGGNGGVYFSYNGNNAGFDTEVEDGVFTFQSWYGEDAKNYDSFEDMSQDKFFGGKSLADLIEKVDMEFC